MRNNKLVFYDFEVFKHLWLVVIIDYQTKETIEIINDEVKLKKTYTKYKDYIWVGYNSRSYDQFILKGILSGYNPYEVSTELIVNNKKGHQIISDSWRIKLYNYDTLVGFNSLKQLEGYMGSSIKESTVPFDLDRKLTSEEINETLKYCTHDVEETINVFENQLHEFDSQLAMIEAFDLDMKNFTKTKSQLSAIALGAVKQPYRNDEFELSFPDTLKIEKYTKILEWYKNPDNMNYKKKLIHTVADVEHVFAWGGIHGAIPNYTYEGIILCCDVASLYPAIMIEYDYLSRNVNSPEKYKEIRDNRIKLKKENNPMQAPLKIVLNSTYGSMKFLYSELYDPLMANNVCVAGQLLLLDLIEKLEPYCELIQSNTDGLFLKVHSRDDIPLLKTIAREWEIRTRLDLEWDEYCKIYQKDVNNYIIIDKNGNYKSKGAYVKKLNKLDNDLPIVNKALKGYFINSIPIRETIEKELKLIEFQRIVKSSGKFNGMYHGENENCALKEKVVRVFASKNTTDNGLFKLKDGTFHKVENTPEKCFINNENVTEELVENYPQLDKEYYINLTEKRILDYVEKRENYSHLQSGITGVNLETLNSAKILIEDSEDLIELFYKLNSLKNKSSIKILIKLGYLDKFGTISFVETLYEYFEFLRYGDAKQLDIEKVELLELQIINIISRNSTQSVKRYNNLNVENILREIYEYINMIEIEDRYSKYDLFNFQVKYCPRNITFKTENNEDRVILYILAMVPEFDRNGDINRYLIKARSLGSGKESPVNISKTIVDNCNIKLNCFIKMLYGKINRDGYYQIYDCELINL